jgi:signal transduction histidine kinase
MTKEDINLKFAALLVHDLETPLAVARRFINRVEQGKYNPEDERHRKLAGSTRLAVDRAERILEDLLDQVRAGEFGFSISISPVNLRELIEECIEVVRPLSEDVDLEIQLQMKPDSPEMVYCDRRLISRVVDNFLVNAIRHSARNKNIQVQAEKKNGAFQVEVQNQLEAPLEYDLDEIFQPEIQVDLRAGRKHRGAGLGLTFSRMVVEAHDGQIGVKGGRNGKVVFWFNIPVAQEKEI